MITFQSLIIEKIKSYTNIQSKLLNRKIFNYINSMEKLPTLPSIMYEVQTAIEKSENLNKIANMIEKDPVLTAKIMHIINSAFYGLKNVKNLQQALQYIGTNVILDLIVLNSLTSGDYHDNFTINEIYRIADRSFKINKCINKYINIKKLNIEELHGSSVGVIHDIGKIILLKNEKEYYKSIKDLLDQNKASSFYDAEIMLNREGVTHQEIGAYFLKLWNFNINLVNLTLNHNCGIKVEDSPTKPEQVLYICCRLVDSFLKNECYEDKKFNFISESNYNEIKEFIMEENL